jgi:small subunit ribosomal protein S8
MVTDPIADLLTRIKNALSRKRSFVYAPHSTIIEGIAKLLKEKTIIDDYSIEAPEANETGEFSPKRVRIELAYDIENGQKVSRITEMRRVSRPGVRSYSGYREMQKIRSGFGVAIVSTSRGLMTDVDARREKAGGEILFEVW